MPKDKTFNLRLDAADRRRLEMVAKDYAGASMATVIRVLIQREYERVEERRRAIKKA